MTEYIRGNQLRIGKNYLRYTQGAEISIKTKNNIHGVWESSDVIVTCMKIESMYFIVIFGKSIGALKQCKSYSSNSSVEEVSQKDNILRVRAGTVHVIFEITKLGKIIAIGWIETRGGSLLQIIDIRNTSHKRREFIDMARSCYTPSPKRFPVQDTLFQGKNIKNTLCDMYIITND